jgi:hypothetical protein
MPSGTAWPRSRQPTISVLLAPRLSAARATNRMALRGYRHASQAIPVEVVLVCADNSSDAGATDLAAGNAEEGGAPTTGFAAAAAAAVADAGAIRPGFVAPGGVRFPDVVGHL